MTELNRRNFAAALATSAAVFSAVPATAQRRRMGMGMGAAPLGQLTAGNWMDQVRAQHAEIDRHFAMLKGPMGPAMRANHLMMLKNVLTAHSIAEEVALYPGVVLNVDRGAGNRLYQEQQEAKVMLAEIDNMVAMRGRDADFLPRLTALEAAIKAHVGEEEGQAYPRLMRAAAPAMNAKMTNDFRMAFSRYYNG